MAEQLQQKASGVYLTLREIKPGQTLANITFSNPKKLNVASGRLLDQLIDVCKELSQNAQLRAVILTGAPPPSADKTPAFVGGADIQELNALSSSTEVEAYITRVHNACAAVRALPVPVIARIHGYALGAGLELMSSCDLKVATKASRFGMPEAKIGLPSLVEAALFPRLIGMGRTRRLVYLAEILTADVAKEWGLLEEAVCDEIELDRVVDEWVGILAGMGPQNLRLQKRLVTTWENSSLHDGIMAGIPAIGETFADGGKEAHEYMKAFLRDS